MLDLGCGAGFMIDQLRDTFDEIHGIDATRAMLDRVDTSSGNITLHEGVAEHLPFEDGSFDLVTAYSVFHHLEDHRPVLAEARRVFATAASSTSTSSRTGASGARWSASSGESDVAGLDEIVAREIRAVHHIEEDVPRALRNRAGRLPRSRVHQGAPRRLRGNAPSSRTRSTAGFSTCETTYEWFLGQAALMHGSLLQAPTRRRAICGACSRSARTCSSTCASRPQHEHRAEPTPSILSAIRERGFSVVPDLLDEETVMTMKEELERAALEDLAAWEGREYPDAWMVHNLMVRHPVFAEFLENPVLHAHLSPLLGDTCILYAYTSSSMPPRARTSRTESTSTRRG